MKIENEEVVFPEDYLSPVTYVPNHVNGNAGHPDCEQGVLIEQRSDGFMVLYCKSRKQALTDASDLVWG